MTTHRIHDQKEAFYFVTITCYKWLPLIGKTSLYNYFHQWVSHLSNQGVDLCGYVIMPNHFHLLTYVSSDCENFNHAISEGKRFMSYEIVKRLKDLDEKLLLQILQNGVQADERLKGKKHQVFRLSFDAKLLRDENDVTSILDYIHYNPVKGKWLIVNDFIDYSYSSARFYLKNSASFLPIKDYRNIISEFSASNSE